MPSYIHCDSFAAFVSALKTADFEKATVIRSVGENQTSNIEHRAKLK